MLRSWRLKSQDHTSYTSLLAQGHFAKIREMAVLLIFLPQFLSILSNLRSPKSGPDFGDTPDQARSIGIGPDQSGSGPINRDRPRSIGIGRSGPTRPDRESILVMRRSATMPKNGALLLRRACPDEPDDGKYEYYYVSYSY